MSATDKVIIFDTTLRDGEQSPGASMNKQEKVQIAHALELLGVDVIEAGFAIASKEDFAAIHAIASRIQHSVICSLARALDKDIERAADAIQPAARGRIHTFIATSPIHMQYKLKLHPDEVIERAIAAVTKARSLCNDVEFSCEDAARSEFDFLCRIIEKAIAAGARTINIPDTVGYAIPEQFGDTIKRLINNIPNSDKAIFSVHCHNDLGMAVANSLAAVDAGARQIECTINGLGERAGNCALEEVVMAIRTRSDYFACHTDVVTEKIVASSRLVSQITGFVVQPNKAIVGTNAFAHESGIHQHGMLQNRETYEVMRAEDVGWKSNSLVLGKHSGKHALFQRLSACGIEYDAANTEQIFARFKLLADKKHQIFDEDLLSLVERYSTETTNMKFLYLESQCDSEGGCRVTLDLLLNGTQKQATGVGNGPVNAAFAAVDSILSPNAELLAYNVNSVTEGIQAQGVVSVRLSRDDRIVNGTGAHTDIIIASVLAYLNAISNLLSFKKLNAQHAV